MKKMRAFLTIPYILVGYTGLLQFYSENFETCSSRLLWPRSVLAKS